MSKFVLIHGFAIGLTTPIFRPPFGPSAGFYAFDKTVESGEAVVFPWGIERQVNLFQILNPFFLANHYEDEKFLAQARETRERLRAFLEREQPEIIVCHSMGCFLLNKYLENFTLPKSVRAIVFSQSDDIISPPPLTPSTPSSLSTHNLYCPWDPTLLISSIYNKKWRAGLRPARQKGVWDIFFPLVLPFNFHTSGLRDKKLVKFVQQI